MQRKQAIPSNEFENKNCLQIDKHLELSDATGAITLARLAQYSFICFAIKFASRENARRQTKFL